MPENGVYRFGVFELDSRSRELKKQGVRRTSPCGLWVLVQHPAQIVTQEQIQSEPWPAGTLRRLRERDHQIFSVRVPFGSNARITCWLRRAVFTV
jgi:hypothetical protein